ncbi:MAG: hypothetical protein UX02_C0004G0030 [Candidatus Moranbacteria bacterium GW2011_GWC1_45_18]|nr:MAG: hypothetical protein UT79_C0003G0059 [Candidatus Moranbacteria bacterium GW2011_GWC2_40_12]KKT33280.1 MAG: hypothetical protein UW19_C0010G0021 [Candidatus Moranbacteria bacterium GW2011_GWF2_44_10]KKT99310.1 MAG: hypothetical protein UX02_C0004G0030 [Candidatus Moranbacteria bacterium GW2011_GWC1_45_18]OGI24397.1 MAG: hypothetical protein A2194_04720 [Candidatus Moranbacteria bacterium RIFOXYA1_FULL_44_8]OGI36734.1 MAG: hypothetical protein A2407_02920 [Candidatus Moranbacteria bacteri
MSAKNEDRGKFLLLPSMVIGGFAIFFFYNCDLELAVCSVTISSLLIYKSVMLSLSVIQGQGTWGYLQLSKKQGLSYYISLCALKVFKVRARLLLVPGLVAFLLFELIYESFKADAGLLPQTIHNLRAFTLAWVWMLGCVAVYWSFNWKRYFFESEEEVKKYLQKEGLDVFEVAAQIRKLKDMGLFGP